MTPLIVNVFNRKKMASLHPPLEDAQDAGQVLYTSLLVLGLDAAGLELSLRTPVNQVGLRERLCLQLFGAVHFSE